MAVAKKAPAPAAAAPTSTPFTQQVISQVTDPNVRLAMLTGAALEGGTYGAGNTIGVGDQGHSYGYFQINLPFHPGMTPASATDPTQAVAYMKGAYTAAAARVPASLWSSNPEKAAETAAFYAERPAKDYYVARGQSAVDRAYNMAQGALGGPGASTPPAASPGTGPGGSTPSPFKAATGAATPAPKAGAPSTAQTPKPGKKASESLWGTITQPLQDATTAMGETAQSVADVGKTASKGFEILTSVSFWTRAGFIIVGLGLVFIGTKALLSGAPVPMLPPSGNASSTPAANAPKAAQPSKKPFGAKVRETAETVAVAVPK